MNYFVFDMLVLGFFGRNYKQQFFILQKVLVVFYIKIVVYYGIDIDVDVDVDVSVIVLLVKGVDVKVSVICIIDIGIVVREFILLVFQKN